MNSSTIGICQLSNLTPDFDLWKDTGYIVSKMLNPTEVRQLQSSGELGVFPHTDSYMSALYLIINSTHLASYGSLLYPNASVYYLATVGRIVYNGSDDETLRLSGDGAWTDKFPSKHTLL